MNSKQRVELAKKTLGDLYDLVYHLPVVGPEHEHLLNSLANASNKLDVLDERLHGAQEHRLSDKR